MNKSTLLIGPWVGEFGWELFCWQGYARNYAQNYDHVIVLSRKGHDFLYSDFMNEFIPFNAPASKANMHLGEIDNNKLQNIINNYKPDKHLKPFNIGFSLTKHGTTNISNNFNNQKFIKYKSDSLNEQFDIILHPRYKQVGNSRNWYKQKWQNLVNLLVEDNISVATIGTNEAYTLNNVSDYRNRPIKDSVALFNRCKLAVGTSSGPLHLASLCGTPHLVWSEEFNRIRYEKLWNAFNTPVFFYGKEGWDPNVQSIYEKIINILAIS